MDPQPKANQTIYVQVKSTLSQSFSGLKSKTIAVLKSKGWKVVDDVSDAHDMLQINVLQMGEAINHLNMLGLRWAKGLEQM